MPASTEPLRNRLLAALPHAEWVRWQPQLEAVEMTLGRTLAEPGVALPYVYYPTTAVVCMMGSTLDGHSMEIAVIGNEGMIGLPLFLGGDSMTQRAVVQIAGQGFRMNAGFMRREFAQSVPARHLLLRYTQARMAQVGQTAACSRHHSIEQQLCGWLLLSSDRLQSSMLDMTHELIAANLGVRREGVTEAALRLQHIGLIQYRHGHIEILDRRGLEQRTCECYAAVRKEYERLLPATWSVPQRAGMPSTPPGLRATRLQPVRATAGASVSA